MPQPDITIIMSLRESFSHTRRSIESLYAETQVPFDLIFIDGGSPRAVRDYLVAESARRGFKLIRTSYYLIPNESRNLGLDNVKTRYVAFVDNDVVFAPQWLEHLVRCAEETGAAIVSPLICIGEPIHTKIHMAGGAAAITVEGGRRVFREAHYFPERPVAEVRDQLVRKPIELAEYHCMLIRTEWLQRLGCLDEGIKTIYEHVDLCLKVRECGGIVMIEPRAVITQIFGGPLALNELKFFYWHWSHKLATDSERSFHEKWNSVSDDNVAQNFVRPRRRHALPRLRQTVRAFVGWRISEWLFERLADFFGWLAMRDRPATPGPASPEMRTRFVESR